MLLPMGVMAGQAAIPGCEAAAAGAQATLGAAAGSCTDAAGAGLCWWGWRWWGAVLLLHHSRCLPADTGQGRQSYIPMGQEDSAGMDGTALADWLQPPHLLADVAGSAAVPPAGSHAAVLASAARLGCS